MFLNKTVFKKMIKEAYNNNDLTVGMLYEGFVIKSNYWVVWIDGGNIPSWVKAAVIEYTDALPEEGEVFKAGKNNPVQYETQENQWFNLPAKYRTALIPFTVTPLIYKNTEPVRFLQCNKTDNLITLSERLYNVIDLSSMEPDENRPSGPCSERQEGELVMWKNENMAIALCTVRTGDGCCREVMDLLSEITFRKE